MNQIGCFCPTCLKDQKIAPLNDCCWISTDLSDARDIYSDLSWQDLWQKAQSNIQEPTKVEVGSGPFDIKETFTLCSSHQDQEANRFTSRSHFSGQAWQQTGDGIKSLPFLIFRVRGNESSSFSIEQWPILIALLDLIKCSALCVCRR